MDGVLKPAARLVGAILFLPALALAQGTLTTKEGVRLTFLPAWAATEHPFADSVELVTPAGPPRNVQARIYVSTTPYRSHAEAVKHLGEIAAEAETQPEVLQIGGWPALQRAHLAPLPRFEPREGEAAGGDARTLRIMTAVAAAQFLVRLETFLAPGAESKIADQARAIGRGAAFSSSGPSQQLQDDLRALRDTLRAPAANRGGTPAPPPPTPPGEVLDPPAILVNNGFGELEIAASRNGQNVVIAANSKISFSNDSGATYALTSGGTGAVRNINFGVGQDLSVAWGATGRFYITFVGLPFPPNLSLSFGTSTNNGQSFTFSGNPVVCTPALGCGVDQPHVAADRVNAAPGGDQLYAVFRSIGPLGTVAAIACSANNGVGWRAPTALEAGSDFPRVTVSQDGSAYVVYRSNAALKVVKFSSCSSGLVRQPGFPVTIATVTDPICPMPGLDRCNSNNTMSSHMAAVDDLDAQHVYVAFANSTSLANDNVLVFDSTDGGATWPRSVAANSGVNGRRFMPWVCATGGVAMLSWYDRRAATAAPNDLTDYFAGSVEVHRGALRRGPEVNLSGNPDPHCRSGFPCGADTGAQTTALCPGAAIGPPVGGGCKYGDYNGNACAAGRAYFAWTSATAPAGLPPVGGVLSIFASSLQLPRLTVTKHVLPHGDGGTFDLEIDGVKHARGVADGGTTGPQIESAGVHDAGEEGAGTSSVSAYRRAFGGDCAPAGTVALTYGDDKTCSITNTRIPANTCLDLCEAQRDACLDASRETGTPASSLCIQRFLRCQSACSAP